MKKHISLLLAFGSVLLLGAMGLAQQTPKPAPPMAAEEQEGGQARHEGMFAGLNLTDQQREKIKALHEKAMEQAQAIRNDSSLTEEQKRARIDELHESTFAQTRQILTPEQQKLLEERHERMGKGGGFAEGLNLSEDQKEKIKSLHEQGRAQMQAIRNDSSLTEEQKRAKIRELHRSTREQMMQLLTPEQQKELQERHRRHQHGRLRRSGNQEARLDGRRGGLGRRRLGPGFF